MTRKKARRSIYLSDDDYKAIKEKAAEKNLSFNEYTRQNLLNEEITMASVINDVKRIGDRVDEIATRQEITQQTILDLFSYFLGIYLCNIGEEKIKASNYPAYIAEYKEFLTSIANDQVKSALEKITENKHKETHVNSFQLKEPAKNRSEN